MTLMNPFTNSCLACISCPCGKVSKVFSFLYRCSPCLQSVKPLISSAMAHGFLSKCLFWHVSTTGFSRCKQILMHILYSFNCESETASSTLLFKYHTMRMNVVIFTNENLHISSLHIQQAPYSGGAVDLS